MNLRIIFALVIKDMVLYFRNKLFLLITIVGTVAYLVLYFVMPSTVNENLKAGLYSDTPTLPPVFQQLVNGGIEGLDVVLIESEQELLNAVDNGEFIAGITLPEDLLTGPDPQVGIYLRSDTPAEVADSFRFLISEITYLQAGELLPATIEEEVIGIDLLGRQIPTRDRLRTLLPTFLILTQLFGLATLISEEFEGHTVRAVLVSPATIADFFVAKGIFGVGMAFGQALILMAIIGGLSTQVLIVIITLLLASLVTTGIGFIAGAISKDNMSAVSWGFALMFILLLPAMAAMLPGYVSDWIRIIPSYYMVDILHRATNFNAGWSDVWSGMVIMLGVSGVFIALGILALRRKIR